MKYLNIKNQIRKLYMITSVGYFAIAGASWVALLAARGFTLLQIGMIESIFHIISFCFEIPSGAVADVVGRKKTMVMSQAVSMLSAILMICSKGFVSTAIAIGCNALSYNLTSGTREAFAYDSLKAAGNEEEYNHFASTEMMLYRITTSTATLCAGLALKIGYRRAYTIDLFFYACALLIACTLTEIPVGEMKSQESFTKRMGNVFTESFVFLKTNHKVRVIMIINALIGAIATLVLFFLQAKLPASGLSESLLGPALFFMGLGAACGSKLVSYFPGSRYSKLLIVSSVGVAFAFAMSFTGKVWLMVLGGFTGAFADDFLQVRTDVILNEMLPSEQRATLVSVSSFVFSVIMIFMSTLMGWVMG